ncbi:hypothetical protein BGW36DRAFT_413301 [Talaromyces proteolyticus]|uniref:xylan 1,4-beta-xylosidase n=1 Tax=Talaromyces proteolyticus TaxID=1131652 RepID=A0AAD4L3L2_9EURO|nr:uncharacterized protein BGW36DRAFT_413301 [Talaromyces proteolyticus]KAH8705307.1 hypothetical protein BGW36DRAFT_413301 [Talaromyces proteolyticus]
MFYPWIQGLIACLLVNYAAATAEAEFPDCTKEPLKSIAVCDTNLDTLTRAKALVAEFTLEEKIANVVYNSSGVPRLGLPQYTWWSEGLHGVALSPGVSFASSGNFSCATSFPTPITIGAAFDDPLVKQIGNIISTEARAFNNEARAGLDYWTPNINPFRDPRWGRGQETPGEDPFHIQQYVYQLIGGLQGGIGTTNPKVAATCKHFAGYDIENWHGNARYGYNAIISTQDLSEYYLPSFKTCARDAKVEAIMCSYNAVNGIPACANSYLMETILRQHWNWSTTPGHWITSDCDAIANIYDDHHYTNTGAEAAADALNAGTDLDCGPFWLEYLPAAFSENQFDNRTLDTALTRLYSSLIRLGYFDPSTHSPYRTISWADVATPESTQLALTAAVEGIVLLKNDAKKTLPIARNGQTIAIIGPYGNATSQFLASYEGVACHIPSLISAAEALRYHVLYEPGTSINDTNTTGFGSAINAARAADVIVFAGGIDGTIEAEAKDRETISWPGNQLDLINQLSNVGKPLVVVQFGGGQVDDSSLLANPRVNALLWAGYPGQAGGQAVWEIITGITSPAGRLPVTQYPASYVDQVPMTDMGLRPSPSSPGRTYRWYENAVLPFGFGLHYTTFDISWASHSLGPYSTNHLVDATQSTSNNERAEFDTFHVNVKNTGNVVSDYVALLFLSTSNAGPAPYPIKTLVGYTRAGSIRPGETRHIAIQVQVGSVARTDTLGNLVLYPGSYSLHVDIGEVASSKLNFTIKGEPLIIDKFPQPPA